jgi:uncharacterized protein (TIGR02118 family)
MVKVSVLYPNTAGCKFDMTYYLAKHMPMVKQKLGAACKSMAVEEGIAGGAPGAPATYVAMGHLYFDSSDAFQSGLRAARAGHSWRHPELHQHPADHSDQRSQNVAAGGRGDACAVGGCRRRLLGRAHAAPVSDRCFARSRTRQAGPPCSVGRDLCRRSRLSRICSWPAAPERPRVCRSCRTHWPDGPRRSWPRVEGETSAPGRWA